MNEDNSVVIEDGNLKVWNSNGKYTYFSTQLGSSSNRKVELLDTGNLVLDDESGGKLRQSLKLTDSISGIYTF